ncbi:hypothetical protein V3C99_000987 [Haemonchus contortus]|uniref:BOS complex subunit TMEM147 n=1 Tax=Haemonchus contortus TaxID=6289 RepID=A0A7I4Z6I1_HAECO|nr:Protein of unknown function DUF2053 domain containing protein [Haemonchus contortus]
MTFFHFINCVTLAYAPYFIAYKYSGLNEYSSFWRCAQASGGYFLTQLVKLLLLATFFPAADTEGFAVLPELLKSSADVVDVIGMHLVMTHVLNGKGEVRFLVGGLGWGAAHSVASSFILFWVGARASAFSWRWIQMALESSSDLILFVAMAALTWMATRAASRHLVFMLLTACVFHTFVYQMLYSVLHIRGWLMVVARFAFSSAISAGTFLAYSVAGSVSQKRE